MVKKLPASLCAVSLFLFMPQCMAQSVLDQGSDELLKGFDVDPAYVRQFQRRPATSNKGPLQKLIDSAMPLIDVDTASGASGIKVNVPFVNVNVGGSQEGVKVRAPFVNVDTGQGVSVQAPFVNFGTPS